MKHDNQPSSRCLYPIVGRRWRAVVNGRNSRNGALYSVTFNGDISAADDDNDAYDVVSAIAEELKTLNAEMLHVHSLQITLGSPPNACMSESPTSDAARESGTASANGDSLHADVLTPKPKMTK